MIPERDFSTRRRPRGRRPGDVAALAVAAALLAASTYAAGTAWIDARQARASYDAVRQDLAASETRARALQASTAGEGAVGARAMWSAEAPPPRVVEALAQMMPPDVRLEGLTLRYGAQLEVEMKLRARTAPDYDRFLQALEASPVFDGIELGDESRDEDVQASVRARYRAGEGS